MAMYSPPPVDEPARPQEDAAPHSREQIRPAPDFASSVDTAYIMGLGALGERMLIVVDIERLMLSSEMALVDEAAQ